MPWAAVLLLAISLFGTDPPDSDDLNARVLEFARSQLGKKVGNGDCGALASIALRESGGRWVKPGPIWGERVDTLDEARPGDILQFEDAVFQGREVRGTAIRTWTRTLSHHTAIVSRISRKRGVLILKVLHQNVGNSDVDEARRKVVQEWTLNLGDLKQGTIRAFRPVSASVQRDSRDAVTSGSRASASRFTVRSMMKRGRPRT